MKIFSGYVGAGKMLASYWHSYGGLKALLLSPYVHFSGIFLILNQEWRTGLDWINDSLSVIPSILGFSLGAFAVFLAFADQKFVALLTSGAGAKTSKTSAYLKISSLFVHFMVVQVLALLFAVALRAQDAALLLAGKSTFLLVVSGMGFFLFIYSILTAAATSLSLMRLAVLYNKFRTVQHDEPNESS